MLFDLQHDPSETTDIASQHKDIVQRMRKVVEDWQASCKRSLDGADYRANSR
jgi:hypothetical protein